MILKGVCHEIFYLHFFHDLNPSRPLIHRLKYFWSRFQFHQDIKFFKKIPGVHHTVDSSVKNFSKSFLVSILPRVKLHAVHHTGESNCTQQSQTKIFVSLWLLLKGQSGEVFLTFGDYFFSKDIYNSTKFTSYHKFNTRWITPKKLTDYKILIWFWNQALV